MARKTKDKFITSPVRGNLSRIAATLVVLLFAASTLSISSAQSFGRKRGFFFSNKAKKETAQAQVQPAALTWTHPSPGSGRAVEAITFAIDRSRVYIPVSDIAYHLGGRCRYDARTDSVRLDRSSVSASSLRRLVDGTPLVSVRDLEQAGVPVSRGPRGKVFNIGDERRFFTAVVSSKRSEVDLAGQRLRAWQGSRKVLECRISSGKHRGSTPTGSFSAGPYKNKLHLSSLYENSPMPWSVQITGHVFIHGYSYVPNHPASHGCVRVPLNEGNPAKFFYEWVDPGAPVRIRYGSSPAPAPQRAAPLAARVPQRAAPAPQRAAPLAARAPAPAPKPAAPKATPTKWRKAKKGETLFQATSEKKEAPEPAAAKSKKKAFTSPPTRSTPANTLAAAPRSPRRSAPGSSSRRPRNETPHSLSP